jgi:ATP synthase protein I
MDKDEKKEDGDTGNSYLKYSGLGFQMIVIIGGFAYAGHKIDESAKHSVQWVTAAMSLAGVFISLFIVIRSVKS